MLTDAPDEAGSVAGCDSGPEDGVEGVVSEGVASDGVESDGVGVDVDGAGVVGVSVDGHGEGVTPLVGVGVSVPVIVTHGTGDDGEVDGEVDEDVDGDVDGVCVGGGGGVVCLSCWWPLPPGSRAIHLSECGS
ncbi:hypothetical protein RGF97_31370 [Streptomyces roseicoloratus]|uniref:Uncharacterized protein n=1 Tax=Streptomyces roseicoloratus TaxID=2508722 RepID=A0ABY9S399_9ACTN|nr:hypothetical protein [Streptomyces roseicoloratus]WMX48403.1 hypothetical protein RGF97_31370 [Streptomyces roseicoloratus]